MYYIVGAPVNYNNLSVSGNRLRQRGDCQINNFAIYIANHLIAINRLADFFYTQLVAHDPPFDSSRSRETFAINWRGMFTSLRIAEQRKEFHTASN